MEYRITKEELGNELLFCTLIALEKCMQRHGLPLYVVGARARDVAMRLMKADEPKRRTEDLDVAIAVDDWAAFDEICHTLQENHFKRYKNTQKFFYKGENGELDFEVDVVPFGGVAVDEKIAWPPEGNPVMSVKCFNDVMKEAVQVIIEDQVSVKIAPLCGQFLIKLDTWHDRHNVTDKDAEDMLFILKSYLDIQLLYKEDNVPPEVVTFRDEDASPIVWGAQWLAYDISKLLSTEHLKFYSDFVSKELAQEENSELIYHFMRYWGGDMDDIDDNYDTCRLIWSVIGDILLSEFKKRVRYED